MTELNNTHSVESWDSFWREGDKSTVMPCFGGQAENLRLCWRELLKSKLPQLSGSDAVADLAAGNGIVVSIVLQLLKENDNAEFPRLISTDYSYNACKDASHRDKLINALCSRSEALPFADGSVALVLTQFGIEYAGVVGFLEAYRVLKPKGDFIGICHVKNGLIYNECALHVSASQAFYDSNIFSVAENVFRQANAVIQGKADQSEFVAADREFSHAVNICKQVFGKFGKAVCAGYLYRVFAELGQMFNSIQQYALADVLAWIENNKREMRAYIERMRTMTFSAMDEDSLSTIENEINSLYPDFSLELNYQALYPRSDSEAKTGEQVPIAWIVEMSKGMK